MNKLWLFDFTTQSVSRSLQRQTVGSLIKDLEGRASGLIEVISWVISGGTDRYHERSYSG